jgi:hypothetical protein
MNVFALWKLITDRDINGVSVDGGSSIVMSRVIFGCHSVEVHKILLFRPCITGTRKRVGVAPQGQELLFCRNRRCRLFRGRDFYFEPRGGLHVYATTPKEAPREVSPPPGPRKYWRRRGIAEWLVDRP